MAFERRGKSGGTYFYLTVRDAATGEVKKQYLGRGGRARDTADAIARRRDQREADRRAVQTERAATRAADDLMAELDAAATVVMEAVLLAAGFHQPNYGPWRRRRHDHGGSNADAPGGAG
jgi:hypothetical protein